MKPTALAQLTENLISKYLFKQFYPSKRDKRPKPPASFFYEVKYIIKGEEVKGVSYKRATPKAPSRRDVHRGNV